MRLKDKLGTKSMASGEIRFEGATAYLLGDVHNGFKQMMDQVNLSRLSHGVRFLYLLVVLDHRCVSPIGHSASTVRRMAESGKGAPPRPVSEAARCPSQTTAIPVCHGHCREVSS